MKDYYLALGVDRNADTETIKKAYREFCKKYHPDSCDIDDAATRREFLAVREAYDTLSDRDKKKDYDRDLEGSRNRGASRSQGPGRRHPLGPMYGHGHRDSMDPGGEWGGASLFESLFDRVEKGMFGSFSGVSPGTALHAELVLSRYEAAVGGTYRIEVPITERCGYCFRFGGLSSGFCPVCGGSGRIRTTRPIDLDVPAGVADGTRNTVRLDSEDTDGILLTIDVAVEGRPIR